MAPLAGRFRFYRAPVLASVIGAWGLSADPPLFNEYSANHPPFTRHVVALTGNRPVYSTFRANVMSEPPAATVRC